MPDGLVILPTAFAGDTLTPEAWTAVQVHLDRLRRGNPGTTLAVRSSAVSDDSARASFARELGIPAVVGCGNATARLHTGDRVLVDGAHGTVEILEGL